MSDRTSLRLVETRQRHATCHELGCGPYHPSGHLITEKRQTSPWEITEIRLALDTEEPRE